MTYYPSLDGVRAIAVAIVLFAHAGVPHVRSGGTGVDVFFTLSGFLITTILLAELDRYHSIRLLNFYARRFLRLLPCLWLTLAAVLFIWVVAGRMNVVIPDVVYAGTYSMNWFRAYGSSASLGHGPLAHTWTLAIEEQYYLVWPFVVGIACRNPDRRLTQGCCLLAVAAMVVGYRCEAVEFFSRERIHYGLDTHADPLLIGSALACFVSARRGRPLPPIWSRLVGYILAPAAVIGVGVIVVNWTWGAGPPALTIGYPLVALCSVIVLLDCVSGSHSLLRPLLELSVLVWVGRISYGVYLWHGLIFTLLRARGIDGWPSLLVAGTGLTLGASALSYYGVERYCLRLKELFTRSGSVALALEAVTNWSRARRKRGERYSKFNNGQAQS
jgi:peptidoglycan/LPS O-acetylase OafA/YrhL